MEKLNLNEMRELNGKLVGLSDESVVDVECLELWAGHRKKLSQVLEKGLVTRDTQEYMVDTLIIKIAGFFLVVLDRIVIVKQFHIYFPIRFAQS